MNMRLCNTFLKVVVITLLITPIFSFNISAQTQVEDAYALFLFNFAKYSSWPSEGESFTFGVIENTKVFESLKHMGLNKKINGKKIIVETYNSVDNIRSPQVLFVSDSKSEALKQILAKTAGQPIMIITENDQSSFNEVCVSFKIDASNRIKFMVNDSALNDRKLKMAQGLKNLSLNRKS